MHKAKFTEGPNIKKGTIVSNKRVYLDFIYFVSTIDKKKYIKIIKLWCTDKTNKLSRSERANTDKTSFNTQSNTN